MVKMKIKEVKIKSPTGVVHYADKHNREKFYTTLCSHRDYFRTDGYDHGWPETDEPVTCKRCLKMKLLGQLGDTKFHARIVYNDIRQGAELTLEYAEGNLLKTLISQGYIDKIPKKGEQIEITIWSEL